MPILTEYLSIWEISHRWGHLDPDTHRIRYPLLVKDNFKILMNAIINGEIYCETLTIAKRPHDSIADPKYYIRTYIDEVYDCINGVRFNKKLLKWGLISRDDFKEWCERRSIPLPEFWFPAGWKYEFEEPEYGTRAFWAEHVEPEEPGGFSLHFDIPDELKQKKLSNNDSNLSERNDSAPTRDNEIAKLISQKIASKLWKEYPDRSIAEMMQDEIIQKYSGAANYPSALRKWLSEVAPVNIKGKRGRPRKKLDED